MVCVAQSLTPETIHAALVNSVPHMVKFFSWCWFLTLMLIYTVFCAALLKSTVTIAFMSLGIMYAIFFATNHLYYTWAVDAAPTASYLWARGVAPWQLDDRVLEMTNRQAREKVAIASRWLGRDVCEEALREIVVS